MNRDDFDGRAGVSAHDQWDMTRGGFRADWQPTDADRVTLSGDYYGGESDETSLLLSQSSSDLYGGNAIARWTHTLSQDSDVQLRIWYDRTERDGDLLGEDRDTYDAELQLHLSSFDRHDLVWGAGYRLTADRIRNSSGIQFSPDSRNVQFANAFVQDEISVIENLLSLTFGTKLEYNDYTHFEFLPNARALLTPWERHSFWLAVSRAVRAPSRAENDVAIARAVDASAAELPAAERRQRLRLGEGARVRARLPRATVFEAVVRRGRLLQRLQRTCAASSRARLSSTSPHRVWSRCRSSRRTSSTREGYGVEVSSAWNVVDFWRLDAGYTLMLLDVEQQNSLDPTAAGPGEGHALAPVLRALARRSALALRVRHRRLLGGQRLEPERQRLRAARRPARLASVAVARAQPSPVRTSRSAATTSSAPASPPAHVRAPELLREGDVALLSQIFAGACGRRMRRRLRVRLLLALLCASAAAAHAQTQVSEVSLKSAFLYKFIHYTDWPDEALGAVADPIAICVIEQDALAEALESAVSGRVSTSAR
jgi:hypothetical protein